MKALPEILAELGLSPSDRDQYNLPLSDSIRDRVVAAWIDKQMVMGAVVSEKIKDTLYEIATGNSSLTGRPIARAPELASGDGRDPLLDKLGEFPT
jgi:hypothetical protein